MWLVTYRIWLSMIENRSANRPITSSNVIIAMSGVDHLSETTFGTSISLSTSPLERPNLVQNVL